MRVVPSKGEVVPMAAMVAWGVVSDTSVSPSKNWAAWVCSALRGSFGVSVVPLLPPQAATTKVPAMREVRRDVRGGETVLCMRRQSRRVPGSLTALRTGDVHVSASGDQKILCCDAIAGVGFGHWPARTVSQTD